MVPILAAQSIPPERPRARPASELTGWADWESAEKLWAKLQVPPAPPLRPEEALKTFRVAPGYRLELVAAEPLVIDPIFFEFDADGRIWVVEYQGYMRNLAGDGEGDPICRVVVLEDTNEDGRADRSTVFLDGLVMPRSLSFVAGGVLVAEPPRLWFCRDTNGDLRCDEKIQVGTYGHAGNPQHTANGLRYGIDNWLHSSDSPKRHRFAGGRLIEEPAIHRGQFGVTFDDTGRFMTCYENSALHADLIPAEYLLRNPHYLKAYQRGGRDRSQFGVNVNIAREAQEIFPIRVTPAITLGALELREDGRLRTFTVVAGSCFYNGDQFPDDACGNVFVPEAGGHLMGRLRLTGDLELKAGRFYPAEEEFLASTDERFRPVNSRVGPDGALYIADLYHGIIEHVIFLAPYLERQIKERNLETGLDMGRIYRVVSEAKPIDRKPPKLASAGAADLVAALSHANGWWRLTAQRLLVERQDRSALPALRELALRGTNPLGRLHALWTLHGLDALEWRTCLAAFEDQDSRVQAAGLRLSEPFLDRSAPASRPVEDFLGRMESLASTGSPRVNLQMMLSVGAIPSERAERLMLRLLAENEHPLFRSAAMTGLAHRELEFLQRFLTASTRAADSAHRSLMASLLSQAVVDEGIPQRVGLLLELLGGRSSAWARSAVLDGMLAALPSDTSQVKPIMLEKEPAALLALTRSENEATRQKAYRLLVLVTWPGAAGQSAAAAQALAFSEKEQRLAEMGREQYAIACAACHQPHGGGLANVAPPLAASDWVTGSPERLARVVLHGLYGPIEVNGQPWNLHMPGWAGIFTDEQIAGILTHIRSSWGNAARAIEPGLIARLRKESAGRTLAWTAVELAQSDSGQAGENSKPALPVIRPEASGEIRLPAKLAATYGRELKYRPALDILAPWRQPNDVAEWQVELGEAGSYEVLVLLAADDASAGDHYLIETEGSQIRGTVRSTRGYANFLEQRCGELRLRAGVNRILMRPDGPLKRELADVRALRLVPRKQ